MMEFSQTAVGRDVTLTFLYQLFFFFLVNSPVADRLQVCNDKPTGAAMLDPCCYICLH